MTDRKSPPKPPSAPSRLWERYLVYFHHTPEPFPVDFEEWLQR